MLRSLLLGLSHNPTVKDVSLRLRVTRDVVARFVPGETADAALRAVRELHEQGLLCTIDCLGEDTHDSDQAAAAASAYTTLLARLADEGLARDAEVSVKLSALGLHLGADGGGLALHNARSICVAARNAGTTVTVDMEDHRSTDAVLDTVRELRQDFPSTGVVVQSYLRRTEADCRDLASAGSRVRLCKGAYAEPVSVAFERKHDVDLSYVRCLRILMDGAGYPMVATHDPRLIPIGQDLAVRAGRGLDDFEFQMLYGIRPGEQARLAALGHRVRVYTPFGQDWYGYFMRRLAERPANVAFFMRSFAGKS